MTVLLGLLAVVTIAFTGRVTYRDMLQPAS